MSLVNEELIACVSFISTKIWHTCAHVMTSFCCRSEDDVIIYMMTHEWIEILDFHMVY